MRGGLAVDCFHFHVRFGSWHLPLRPNDLSAPVEVRWVGLGLAFFCSGHFVHCRLQIVPVFRESRMDRRELL